MLCVVGVLVLVVIQLGLGLPVLGSAKKLLKKGVKKVKELIGL